ncbi:MAG TPA: DUF2721 domain-containing protein [Candidatus Acidoferrales bacterium]|nr:DUF2721 domain-containing protein [Candidatus Acidoferrales bacterium]
MAALAISLAEGSNVSGVLPLFQAFVAPAIFVSAAALLLLSLNTRLMGMVSRLRHYLHEKYAAIKEGRLAEAEAYASQIDSIERRAEMIRKAFVLTLTSLTGTIASCLLLGAGIYWSKAAIFAALLFIISILALLLSAVYYLREVSVALTSVREEADDLRFMDTAYATGGQRGGRLGGNEQEQEPHTS